MLHGYTTLQEGPSVQPFRPSNNNNNNNTNKASRATHESCKIHETTLVNGNKRKKNNEHHRYKSLSYSSGR